MTEAVHSPGVGLAQPITDPVTGVYSRALLGPRLEAELARAARSERPCSLFLFDVDFFKTVNDAYGHLRGDEVLRQLADRVVGFVRGFDELFRYGGDEFALLLPDTGRGEAVRLAQALAAEVRGRELPGEPPLHVSISLGVATYPDDGADPTGLLSCADRRNYIAKARGRGVAVADDVETGGAVISSRLWERDAALAAVHEFLTRLEVARQGALTVTGQPGAGHTRFLTEVERIARLRGFQVAALTGDPAADAAAWSAASGPEPGDLLVIADVDAAAGLPAAVARLTSAAGEAGRLVGVVHASVGDATSIGLPFLGVADLAPWSPATMRAWARTALQGEPSRALVSWLMARSGGLPARAAAELDRLRQRDGLTETEDGGWTVTSAVIGGPRRRTRLPVSMTELVGRVEERARIASMLAGARLVTLVGPGGIGKTRLSLAVAAAVAGEFEDGVAFVPLAETSEADIVVAAIAAALDVEPAPGQRLFDAVAEQLAEASLLLVLDNFEQVLVATTVVSDLLAAAPGLRVLATSRERLSLYGERVYQVPPLGLPDLAALPQGAGAVDAALANFASLALFDQRAQAANADFAFSAEILPAVAALCHRLDGLPLAIELAAARTDRWRPEALLADLGEHLDALGDGPADLPARQQTLRGAIDWSVRLLEESERRLFTRLAVFAGGATVEAACAVVAPDGAAGEPELAALVRKSLLVRDTDPDGVDRYRMLETIRAYALARLAEDASEDAGGALRRRHAAYFACLAERSAEELSGPDQVDSAARLEREYLNMRAAFAATMSIGDVDTATRFCLGLWRYWGHGNHLDEGRDWCDQVLTGPNRPREEKAVELLYAAAVLADEQEDHAAAAAFAERGLVLAERLGDEPGIARAHNGLGIAAVTRGDYEAGRAHHEQGLAIWRRLGEPRGTAIALGNLTKVAMLMGDLEWATRYADECLRLERAAGNMHNVLLVLESVVDIQLAENDLAGAKESLGECVRLSRLLGDAGGEAMASHQLGTVALLEGDRARALRLMVEALERRNELGDHQDLAVSFDSVAAVLAPDQPALAAELMGAAEALRGRHGLPEPVELAAERQETQAVIRLALDERAVRAAWAAGRSAPLELIVDRAKDIAG